MDKLKQWIALTVVACLGVLAAGWFLVVSPTRDEAQQLTDRAVAQQATNGTLQTRLAMLKAQAKDLPAQQARLAEVAAKIPDDPALPGLIRALDRASADAGVELVSIAPSAPAPVVTAAPAAAAPAAAPVDPAAGTAPGTAPAAGTTTAAPATSLSSIPVAINVVGGYFEVQQFVSSLEALERALRVTGLTLAPGANPVDPRASTTALGSGRSLAATITSQVYMSGATPAVTAAAAPAAPVAPAPAPAAPAS